MSGISQERFFLVLASFCSWGSFVEDEIEMDCEEWNDKEKVLELKNEWGIRVPTYEGDDVGGNGVILTIGLWFDSKNMDSLNSISWYGIL